MRRIPSTIERTLSDIEVFVQSALAKFKTDFGDVSVGFFRSHHHAAPEKEAIALLSPLLEVVRAAQSVSSCDIEPKSEKEAAAPCPTPAQFF